MFVAVHLSFLSCYFILGRLTIIMKFILTSSGESFIVNPCPVMSVDPLSNVIDAPVGLVHRPTSRKITQKRGVQLKLRIIDLVENSCVEESIEHLKFFGLMIPVCFSKIV